MISIAVVVLVAFIVLAVIKAAGRERTSHSYNYQLRKPFLSPAERSFYGVLCQAVAEDYVVLTKVRVADVITPNAGQDRSRWQSAFNRISSKHFDYVLCDRKSLSVAHVVELHDRSHQSHSRAKRDDFLRQACRNAGLRLHEFVAKPKYSLDEIRNQISDRVDVK